MTIFFFDYATYFFALLPKSYHIRKWAPMLKMFEIHPLRELSSNLSFTLVLLLACERTLRVKLPSKLGKPPVYPFTRLTFFIF